jgi:hypothetical protein
MMGILQGMSPEQLLVDADRHVNSANFTLTAGCIRT